MSEWQRCCVLCVTRGRKTQLEQGHVCPACEVRLDDDLASIATLARIAASDVTPAAGRGTGRSVPASRPPIDLDRVEPSLTLVRLWEADPSSTVTVIEVVESWERIVREERGWERYGPASSVRLAQDAPCEVRGHGVERLTAVLGVPGPSHDSETSTALYGVVAFLRAQVPWMTSEPGFGIEQIVREVGLCVAALRRWDPALEREPALVLPCPTMDDSGRECGMRLRLVEAEHHVWCRRCGREWTRERLLLVATSGAQSPDVWCDLESAEHLTGRTARTIQRWAAAGVVRRRMGAYSVRDLTRCSAGVTDVACVR